MVLGYAILISMLVVHETIPREPSGFLHCRDFSLERFDCSYHRHAEFEVVRIDESRGRVLAGDYAGDFEPGELYVFGNRLPHDFINPDGTERARSRCLQFDPEVLQTVAVSLPELADVANIYRRASRGLQLRGDAAQKASTCLDGLFETEGLGRLSELFRLLDFLNQCDGATELASQGYRLNNPNKQLSRLESVLTYIHENAAETPSVAELAVHAGMSESALHRLFRLRMGTTPVSYIQEVRLSSIAHQLLEADASISEIAFNSGFNNLSNFNRQFRQRFQCTPREYRKQVERS